MKIKIRKIIKITINIFIATFIIFQIAIKIIKNAIISRIIIGFIRLKLAEIFIF